VRTLIAVVLIACAAAGCASSGVRSMASAAGAGTAAPSLQSASPCGHGGTPPRRYDHVVWIVMENHAGASVVSRSAAPYTAQLARRCALATNYYAIGHPSLPNYVALTSGSTHGIGDDAGPAAHPLPGASIFSLTGGSWRALEQSMPGPCDRSDTSLYAVRHDPAVYYRSLAAVCRARVVALGRTPDLSARFTFVTPNIVDDTHNAGISTGDAWLARFLPAVFRTPQYRAGRTAVFVTWDEDDGSAGNRVALLAIAPTIPAGTRDQARLSHYSLLRTTEQLLGLTPLLGQAAHAPSMRAGLHL
jgi:hypothetical protein